MADRFPLILNTSANQIQEIASGDSLDLTGSNITNAGIITANNVTIGAATTDLLVNGDARITGILTIGTSSITLDEGNNTINVGTALTLGHTQGFQFHTQSLHSTGFEVNQINASGIITATQADINGDLDVDGHTNLDNVSVAGVTTFAGNVTTNAFLYANTINSSGAINLNTGSGSNVVINRGLVVGAQGINMSGGMNVSDVNISKDLDVNGHTNLDNVSIAGFTTITQDLNVDGHTNLDNISVAGVTTFSNDITFTGTNYNGWEWDKSADLIRLKDNTRLYMGSGASDFNMRHDGTYNWIQNQTGYPLLLDGGSGGVAIISGANYAGGKCAQFIHNGAAELYWDNSKKLETTTTGIDITGNVVASGNVAAVDGTFSGNVSIGGTITYEDVSNIDSVGIVTARSGLVSPNADIDDFISVGSNIHLGNAGVVTATSFVGSGAALTGIDATSIKDSGGNVKIQAQASGAVHSGISTFNEINLGDSTGSGNNRLKFGVGNEFQIYHNSVHSIIENSTGSLWLKSTHAGHIYLYSGNSHGIYIEGDDGHVYPSSDSAIDIGSNAVRFRNVYADTLYGDGSNLTGITQTTINSNTNNYLVTGTGTANTLQGEQNLTFNGTDLAISEGGTLKIGTSANLEITSVSGNKARIQSQQEDLYIETSAAKSIILKTNRTGTYAGWTIETDGDFVPSGHKTCDIGSSSKYVDQSYLADINCEHIAITGNIVRTSTGGNIGSSSYKFSNVYATNFHGSGANLTGIVISSDAQYNTVGGTLAGNSFSGTSATDNTLFGYRAGASINTGDWNTVLGAFALDACTSGSFNLALGRNALTALTDGIKNIAVGHETLASNQSADNNVAVGAAVMNSLSTGEYNTAVGNSAMLYQDTAVQNTSLGYETLKVNTKSSYNVAIGYQSMVTLNRSDAGGQNTAVGHQSAKDMTDGRYNACYGSGAGRAVTSGEQNTIIGAYAAGGSSAVTGDLNTFIGYGAGKDSTTSGSNNTIIGCDAEASSATVSNEVTIGDTNVTKFRIPGINVTLKDNGGTPTQGHVLTVDANGEAGFAAASGVSVANQSNNRLITCSGSTDALNSEANLTYDAVTLKNIISVSGSVPDLLEFRNSASTWGGGFRFGTNNSYGALYITNNDKSVTVGLFNSTGGWNWNSNLRLHGGLTPNANNSYDIGSSSLRWRNIYTNDINLSNEGGANDVDGTWGNYTIQEGESDLFLINKRNGKKYKFNLTEVS